MAGGYLKIMLTVPKSANTKITFKPKLYDLILSILFQTGKLLKNHSLPHPSC